MKRLSLGEEMEYPREGQRRRLWLARSPPQTRGLRTVSLSCTCAHRRVPSLFLARKDVVARPPSLLASSGVTPTRGGDTGFGFGPVRARMGYFVSPPLTVARWSRPLLSECLGFDSLPRGAFHYFTFLLPVADTTGRIRHMLPEAQFPVNVAIYFRGLDLDHAAFIAPPEQNCSSVFFCGVASQTGAWGQESL